VANIKEAKIGGFNTGNSAENSESEAKPEDIKSLESEFGLWNVPAAPALDPIVYANLPNPVENHKLPGRKGSVAAEEQSVHEYRYAADESKSKRAAAILPAEESLSHHNNPLLDDDEEFDEGREIPALPVIANSGPKHAQNAARNSVSYAFAYANDGADGADGSESSGEDEKKILQPKKNENSQNSGPSVINLAEERPENGPERSKSAAPMPVSAARPSISKPLTSPIFVNRRGSIERLEKNPEVAPPSFDDALLSPTIITSPIGSAPIAQDQHNILSPSADLPAGQAPFSPSHYEPVRYGSVAAQNPQVPHNNANYNNFEHDFPDFAGPEGVPAAQRASLAQGKDENGANFARAAPAAKLGAVVDVNAEENYEAKQFAALGVSDSPVSRARISRTVSVLGLDRELEHWEEHVQPKEHRPIFTWVISAVFCIVFTVEMYKNDWKFANTKQNPLYGPDILTLADCGAKETTLLINGDYYRIISPIVLHSGIVHLIVNIMSLLATGIKLERAYGTLKIIIIFVVAGIMGELFSALFNPNAVGVGASGATMGITGSLFGEFFHNYKKIKNDGNNSKFWYLIKLILNTVIEAAIGLIPLVDNWAHIGGVIGGVLVSSILFSGTTIDRYSGRPRRKPMVVLTAAFLLIVIFTVCLGLLWSLKKNGRAEEFCHWCNYLSCLDVKYWNCDTSLPVCLGYIANTTTCVYS
jgi:membrane associated rhomboid family serine protease